MDRILSPFALTGTEFYKIGGLVRAADVGNRNLPTCPLGQANMQCGVFNLRKQFCLGHEVHSDGGVGSAPVTSARVFRGMS